MIRIAYLKKKFLYSLRNPKEKDIFYQRIKDLLDACIGDHPSMKRKTSIFTDMNNVIENHPICPDF